MSTPAVDTDAVVAAIETVWAYHHVNHPLPARADGILCLCSSDLGVARHAAQLFLNGTYQWLMFSGGHGTGIHSGANMLGWDRAEALVFRDEAVRCGVPVDSILTEEASTNTGANVRLSRAILEANNLPRHHIVVVQKPFMERRAYATFKKVWPEPDIAVSSVDTPWEEYAAGCELDKDMIVNIMVGDLQRIKLYSKPPTDFQIHQDIPDDVWTALEVLVKAGYTKNLIQ
eukprot:m.208103 g.208103  ORF g.208103 m.208103 type:complete len:230 (+) comp24019_c0_seq1:510-1199(+)